jgi:hypothetical protein
MTGGNLDLSSLAINMKSLTDKTLPENHLHWTFEIINYQFESTLLSLIVSEVQPDVITIRKKISRNQTLEAIAELSSVILQAKSPIAIGVSGLELSDVQYCLDSNSIIAVVDVGVCLPPNIHVHAAEFCHSRGRNSMVDLPNLDPSCSEVIQLCAEKYYRDPTTILAKAILQIGSIVCLPCSLLVDDRILTILELNHPFTHLQTVRDPSNLTRLVLSNEEMEAISADSIVAETENETSKMKMYVTRPGVRQLRNFSTVGLSSQGLKRSEQLAGLDSQE